MIALLYTASTIVAEKLLLSATHQLLYKCSMSPSQYGRSFCCTASVSVHPAQNCIKEKKKKVTQAAQSSDMYTLNLHLKVNKLSHCARSNQSSYTRGKETSTRNTYLFGIHYVQSMV
jgi:hypothetical protein